MELGSQAVKKCSQCQTPAPLDAALCEQCGRVFPMQSASAMLPPPAYAPASSPGGQGKRLLIGVCFTLVILGGGLFVYNRAAGERETQAVPIPAQAPNPGAIQRNLGANGKPAKDMKPNPQFYKADTPGH